MWPRGIRLGDAVLSRGTPVNRTSLAAAGLGAVMVTSPVIITPSTWPAALVGSLALLAAIPARWPAGFAAALVTAAAAMARVPASPLLVLAGVAATGAALLLAAG
jgi:hypothetical protein